jgi:lysozyme
MLGPNAHIRAQCAEFIKKEEGLRLKPYICPGGMKTVGYGHVLAATDSVKEISEEAAYFILKDDIGIALDAIDTHVQVNLNDNQIIALCSFIFNVGVTNFKKSTLLKKLNAGACPREIATEFHRWNKTKGSVVLTGLVNRRRKEAELFLTPVSVPIKTIMIKAEAKKKPWFLELLVRFLDLRKKA